MNPFDLKGPDFLQVYFILLLGAFVFAGGLRWLLRAPGAGFRLNVLNLSPYEIAYLAGGEKGAVYAAVAHLAHIGAIAIRPVSRTVSATAEALPADAAPFEQTIFSLVHSGQGISIPTLQRMASGPAYRLRSRLVEEGFVLSESAAQVARFTPFLVMAASLLMGAVKIYLGVAREKPVLYLVVMCVVAAVVSCALFLRPIHRSRRGDAALARLKAGHAPLKHQASARVEALTGQELAIAMALFGSGILTSEALRPLQKAYAREEGSGWMGGGTGGSCGSSCGGGGGGGCGGGGCGGCSS